MVAVSESTADDLIRRGMDPDRVTVIPNGVDADHYTPGDPGARFPEPTLLYLGRLKRYKRVDLPIRALAHLAGQGMNCRLLVAGKGDDRPRLERLVSRLGVGDRVKFLGFVPEEEKVRLLQRSWVHVLTSPKEGWGIANLEAAACGTPTVASDSPGLRDSVRDGETGFLVPHGDVSRLAARIEELFEAREQLEEMGRRARDFAEGFSWDRTARRMAFRMERLLGHRVAEDPDVK